MPLASAALSLDIVKSPFAARSQRVCVRVGDKGAYRLSVELLRGGAPLPMSGLSATLKAVLADGTYAEAACAVDDAAAGLVSCTLGGAFASVPGACREAYVEVAQGASVVGSTGSFELLVERGADLSAGQAAAYASRVDALAERAEGLADGLEETIASADITVSAARLDPGSEPTATVTGSGLAKHVELGIPSATAGVSCEAGPADMVTVHGAAEDAPLVEATVWGEMRHNLWFNPTGTNAGVTATETDDGALTLGGTASNYVSFCAETFALKPSTSYTISVDKNIGTEATATLNVREKRADGSYIDPQHNALTGGTTFTTSSDMVSCECRLIMISGTAVSGTYRVMLNEGDAPAPWSPPGLASVESVEVVACGMNLVDPARLAICAYSRDKPVKTSTPLTLPFAQESNPRGIGVVLRCREGVAYTCAYCGPSPYGTAGIAEYASEGDVANEAKAIGYVIASTKASQTYTAKGDGWLVCMVASRWTTGGASNLITFDAPDIAVCVGDSAEYSPYSGSACPVPLPAAHPYLASLPDGTRDELHIYWDGTAELVARVLKINMNGVDNPATYINKSAGQIGIQAAGLKGGSAANCLCDSYMYKKSWFYHEAGRSFNVGDIGSFYIITDMEGIDTVTQANTWLSTNPIVAYGPLPNEVTYWYDGTAWSTTRPARGSLPTLRSAGDPTHVWASTEPASVTADVSAHVLLDGGKALGAEHDYVRRAVDALAAAQSVSESE